MRYEFGEWIDRDQDLTARDVARLCDIADRRRLEMARYPHDRVMEVLEAVSKVWADKDSSYRQTAQELLVGETGFSAEMVSLGLDAVAWTLDPENLEKKVATELEGIPRQWDYRWDDLRGTWLRWQPLGSLLHVLSGNVFVVAAGSLAEGLITGNVNILKMSSSERVFLPLLLRSLNESDGEGVVSRSIAAVDYTSASGEVIAAFKKRVDGIVVWGGEAAVKAYRDDLPARTKLIVFGPKMSAALVTGAGLEEEGVEAVAAKLAREVSIWDQNACTAPQACYVEGEENAKILAHAMTGALEKLARELPPGRLDFHSAAEIRKLRTVFEIAHLLGKGALHESAGGLDWTVVVDHETELTPSPLGRTLRLVPVSDAAVLLERVGELKGYVQTVGLVASRREKLDLAAELGERGVLRLMDLGGMEGGEVDDPHDGAYDLPQLMNRVVHRVSLGDDTLAPIDILDPSIRQELVDSRLRQVVKCAVKAPFYRQRFEARWIRSTADLPEVPVLLREELDRFMAPRSEVMATGPWSGGYVSRSGGSTGEPRFSIYDGPDWEHLVASAVRIFRALGVKRGDRLANCMLAGDLYGSFVSFDHINVRLGVTSFAFAGKLDPEFFLKTWKDFRINVVEGIPSNLVPFLRQVKALHPGFSLETVVYAGSPMSSSDRAWMRDALGVTRVSSVIGANDGGAFAYQCSHLGGADHHVLDDYNYLEIVDEGGHPVPDGEPGRILITSLQKFAFPLIRYEIGDAGRFLPGECPCGRTSRRFEYLGRSTDSLCVGNLVVNHRDFRAALEGTAFSEAQLAARGVALGEAMVLRIETRDDSPGLAAKVRQQMLDRVAKLAERLRDGSLAAFDVEILAPGSLPRNPRSGKVKNVVDERS